LEGAAPLAVPRHDEELSGCVRRRICLWNAAFAELRDMGRREALAGDRFPKIARDEIERRQQLKGLWSRLRSAAGERTKGRRAIRGKHFVGFREKVSLSDFECDFL
jgi:hypothetical protein